MHDPDLCAAITLAERKWALAILAVLCRGPTRFTAIRRSLPGLSANILARRLAELDEHGLVSQHVLPPPAEVAVYRLTDLGHDVLAPLEALRRWGALLRRRTF